MGHADSSAYGVNAENTASSGPFATKSLPRDSSRKRLREDATEENLDNNVVNKISEELNDILASDGIKNINEIIGTK